MRRGRGTAVAVAATVVVTAGGAYVYFAEPFPTTAAATPAGNGSATGLGTVRRGDLSARTMQNGTLGYGDDHDVVNQSNGTLTRLPAVGDVIEPGTVLYRVDGEAVVFLPGASPVFRALSWGDTGADVRQLNRALVALGHSAYGGDYFGRQTYRGVRRLQAALGLEVTGDVPLGQVLFLPPRILRVTSVDATRGAAADAGRTVLKVSSTDRQVTVELTAGQQSSVRAGDRVTITLPTGKSTPGRVASVGRVATEDSEGNVTVTVVITPLRPGDTGSLDKAPVQVSIVSDTVRDVLSVPVTALLALAGGGFAVEVADAAGARRLVRVEVGMVDDSEGRVQVSGAGLADGQHVVVPAS